MQSDVASIERRQRPRFRRDERRARNRAHPPTHSLGRIVELRTCAGSGLEDAKEQVRVDERSGLGRAELDRVDAAQSGSLEPAPPNPAHANEREPRKRRSVCVRRAPQPYLERAGSEAGDRDRRPLVQLHNRRLNRNARCGGGPDVNRMPGRRSRRPSEHRDERERREKNTVRMATSFQDDLSGGARDRPIEAPAVARLFGDPLGSTSVQGKP